MGAPGLFFYLEREGVVPASLLGPLLSRLPPEAYVGTDRRGGEAFDSRRWPVGRDARMASFVARRYRDRRVDAMLAAIEGAAGETAPLRALARRASARSLAAAGAGLEVLMMIWPDAVDDDRRCFAETPWPLETALCVEALAHAHYQAADGLYAYHVHRGLPGPGAEAAARLARAAIEAGRVTAAEVVAAAIELC